METDYTGAITGLVLVGLLLTAMVTYVLARPSDLNTQKP